MDNCTFSGSNINALSTESPENTTWDHFKVITENVMEDKLLGVH